MDSASCRELRARHELTRAALARLGGVDQPTIWLATTGPSPQAGSELPALAAGVRGARGV